MSFSGFLRIRTDARLVLCEKWELPPLFQICIWPPPHCTYQNEVPIICFLNIITTFVENQLTVFCKLAISWQSTQRRHPTVETNWFFKAVSILLWSFSAENSLEWAQRSTEQLTLCSQEDKRGKRNWETSISSRILLHGLICSHWLCLLNIITDRGQNCNTWSSTQIQNLILNMHSSTLRCFNLGLNF